MAINASMEDFEKHRQSIINHIESLNQRSQRLRKKQYLLSQIADKLRSRVVQMNEEFNTRLKEENPFLQIVDVEVSSCCLDSKKILLYLN